MTSYKRWNILTDLAYIETFYERQGDGTLVKAAIPDAGIDFTIDYFTDGATHFKASRIDGVYKDCRQIDEYSLEIFIPLSRRRMCKGELRRELTPPKQGYSFGLAHQTILSRQPTARR